MATIYNSDLSKEIQRGARLQIRDKMPSELAEKVVPVMEVNPRLLRTQVVLGNLSKATTGAGTAFTTSSTGDTFLTGIVLSVCKDAACDMATGGISATWTQEETNAVQSVSIAGLTLTEQQQTFAVNFDRPLKLKKNTTAGLAGNTFAAGTCIRCVTLFGYTLENSGA